MQREKKTVLLTFDVEEFDTPFDYSGSISWEEQLNTSYDGLIRILEILSKHGKKATFFTTGRFAEAYPDLILMMSKTHEIASHGYSHSSFQNEDLAKSKQVLEQIIGTKVLGYRMARMGNTSHTELHNAGYQYNSSLHPTYLPSRYNNLMKKRYIHMDNEVIQFPVSVSPLLRIPLFWLSFKNFPLSFIKFLVNRCLSVDRYVHLYFHPWEFSPLSKNPKFKLPSYVIRGCEQSFLSRLEKFIIDYKTLRFSTCREFLQNTNHIA